MDKNISIGLILGGASPERAVSKLTGKGVYEALLNLGYNVELIDPAYGSDQPTNTEDYFAECDCNPISYQNYLEVVNSDLFDIIFPIQKHCTFFDGVFGYFRCFFRRVYNDLVIWARLVFKLQYGRSTNA